MMIRLSNGKTTAIDYREMAPVAAYAKYLSRQKRKRIKGEGGPLVGYRAAGVPGTVRGMELALKKYGSGKLTWSQLIEPARQLAVNGFTVTNSFVGASRGNEGYLSKYPETKRIYLEQWKVLQRRRCF